MAAHGGALREVLAVFEIDVDDHKIHSANKTIEEAIEHLGKYGEAFKVLKEVAEVALAGLAAEKIYEFTEGVVEDAAAIGKLAVSLGLGAEELQAWQVFAAQAGGDTTDLTTAIRSLSNEAYRAAEGGKEAVKTFAAINLTAKDLKDVDPTELLIKVGSAVAEIEDPTKRVALATQLMGRGALHILGGFAGGAEEVRAKLEEIREEEIGYSDEFVAEAKKSELGIHSLGIAITQLKAALAVYLLPAFDWINEKLKEFVRWTTEQISNSEKLTAILIALGSLVLPTIISALISLTAAIAPFVAEALLAAAPWILIGLAIEDLVVFLEGGDSALGAFLNKLFGAGTAKKVLEEIRDLWAALPGYIEFAGQVVKDFAAGVWGALSFIAGIFETVFSAVVDTIATDIGIAISIFSHLFDWLVEKLDLESWPAFVKFRDIWRIAFDGIAAAGRQIFSSFFGWVADKLANLIPGSGLVHDLFTKFDDDANTQARNDARGRATPALSGQIDTYGNVVPAPVAPGTGGGGKNEITIHDNRETTVHVAHGDSPGEVGRAVGAHVEHANAADRAHILESVGH